MGVELLSGLAHGQSTAEVSRIINVAVERELGLESSLGSVAKDLELDRATAIAFGALTVKEADEDSQTDALKASVYAAEIRATKRAGAGQTITPIGRLIIDLPDRDALRWLLTLEAVQSRGRDDAFRLSRASAAELLRSPKRTFSWPDDSPPWPVTWETLQRLARMGLAYVEDNKLTSSTDFELLAEGHPLLQEIAASPNAPFAVLAAALLQDETSAAVGQVRPAAVAIQSEGAATAIARHARMVAHEIRNALVPVQGTLEVLYRDVERQGGEPIVEKHRGLIDGGIDRIFRFVKEMVNIAERGAEPAELFDVLPAIEDAVAAIRSETGRTVAFSPEGKLPPVRGIRARFTMVLVNLLRNAAQVKQAQPVEIRVLVAAVNGGSGVIVTVDDSGPGVPLEHRTSIFERGFSLREGGTGQGLALVREVVEAEMLGRVACEESPLGGARFVLTIPVAGRMSG
jgi:signal transduction histidine kinase